MLRLISTAALRATEATSLRPAVCAGTTISKRFASSEEESPEEFDRRFVEYFNRPNIDGWEVRRAATELMRYDVVPEPKIIEAALRACRRVNDIALGVRILEGVKIKCGPKKYVNTIYPYVIQEVRPVLDELGIPTPEELGYDKPELFIPEPENYWKREWYERYGFTKEKGYQY